MRGQTDIKPRCSATEPAVGRCRIVLAGPMKAKEGSAKKLKGREHGPTYIEKVLTQDYLCIDENRAPEATVTMGRQGCVEGA